MDEERSPIPHPLITHCQLHFFVHLSAFYTKTWVKVFLNLKNKTNKKRSLGFPFFSMEKEDNTLAELYLRDQNISEVLRCVSGPLKPVGILLLTSNQPEMNSQPQTFNFPQIIFSLYSLLLDSLSQLIA